MKKAVMDSGAPPPASLDAFYPPTSEGPVYLFRMFGIATPFMGITVDLFENDLENAKANFEEFKAQYRDVSKLVPEWEDQFPMEPVEKLGEALLTGDPGQIMPVIGEVGKVCENCHHMNMVKVQQKYHWKNFHDIKVQDPLTNDELGFAQFKLSMEANFVGIGLDLQQGQQKNAQKQFDGFNARFKALKETCKTCHGENDQRKYYVDESVQVMLDQLGEALNASAVEPKVVEELSQGIAKKSCAGCHLVHMPAAFAKERWEHWEEK
jgi:cytochrome c556